MSLRRAVLMHCCHCAQAPVPRVVVLMLNGLDWPTWEREQGVLACLRDRFEPPVRVYGASSHTTSGAQPRACLGSLASH